MNLDIVLVRQYQHSSVHVGDVVAGRLLRWGTYGHTIYPHPHSSPGVHLHAAVFEDEFVSFKLDNRLPLNRDRGSIGVDSRPIFLLSLYEVMLENRGGLGRGISIHPGSPIVVEHRPSRVLRHQRRGQHHRHHAANEIAPFCQANPRLLRTNCFRQNNLREGSTAIALADAGKIGLEGEA